MKLLKTLAALVSAGAACLVVGVGAANAADVPACCAGGNCCKAGVCCKMKNCCKADKSCCDSQAGICQDCGCSSTGCCGADAAKKRVRAAAGNSHRAKG